MNTFENCQVNFPIKETINEYIEWGNVKSFEYATLTKAGHLSEIEQMPR